MDGRQGMPARLRTACTQHWVTRVLSDGTRLTLARHDLPGSDACRHTTLSALSQTALAQRSMLEPDCVYSPIKSRSRVLLMQKQPYTPKP